MRKKSLYLLFSLLAALPCFGAGEGLNTVVFKQPPFSITKPDDWHFMPRKAGSNVLTTLLKHEEPYDGFNTSFTVRVLGLDEEMQGKSASELLAMLNDGFKEGMPDYEALTPIEPTQIASHEAASIVINYTFKGPDGESFPASSETVVIPMQGYFFVIAYSGPRETREADLHLFEAVLNQVTVE